MRPAARLQTTASLLRLVLGDKRPVDNLLRQWARQNRYAGSKDRRAIADALFTVLRHYTMLAARLGMDLTAADSGETALPAPNGEEALMLAMLALAVIDDMPADEVLALADGSRHAPAPLSPDREKTFRHACAHIFADSSMRRADRLCVPNWLLADMDAALAKADADLTALMARAPTDLRVNLLKTDRMTAQQALMREGVETMPHAHIETALRVSGHGFFAEGDSFAKGLVEIQDAGSQALAALCAPRPYELVIDYCAGAGGKALALAALMDNKGVIFAHDAVAARMKDLPQRARRAGVEMVEYAADEKLQKLAGQANLVIADVPCSGSGRWRRAPETKWRLTAPALAELHRQQAQILDAAAAYVKPGSRLAYMTCSILNSENGAQVQDFLSRQPQFVIDESISFAGQKGMIQLSPQACATDGLFCAILTRSEA